MAVQPIYVPLVEEERVGGWELEGHGEFEGHREFEEGAQGRQSGLEYLRWSRRMVGALK